MKQQLINMNDLNSNKFQNLNFEQRINECYYL